MCHVHYTVAPAQTLNRSKMEVTPSVWKSGTDCPMMHFHVLNTTISFHILVWLKCANLLRCTARYVMSEITYSFSYFVAKMFCIATKTVTFLI